MLKRLIAPVITIVAIVAGQLGLPIDDEAQRSLIEALTTILGVGAAVVTAIQPSVRSDR